MVEKRTKNHDVVKAIQDLKNSRIKDLRHDRILIISRLMAIFALVLLIFIRLFSNGTTELTSINGFSVINISIQLFAIINPLSVLPTFEMYVENLDKKDRNKIVDTTTAIVISLIFA